MTCPTCRHPMDGPFLDESRWSTEGYRDRYVCACGTEVTTMKG